MANEHPIQFPKFDGKNFSQWKFRVDLLLEEKRLKVFVDDDLDEVIKNNKDKEIKEDDLRIREKKCKSLLAQTINDEQLSHIMDKETAKEMYETLNSMFQRKSIANQLVLRRRLLTMKFNGEDINNHCLQFDKLIRELKLAGAKLDDLDIVVNLLVTLPRSYDALVTSLESMDEKKLTLEYVKSRLLDEHAKRHGGSTHSKSEGASAMQAINPDITCYGCGEKGHVISRCKARKNKKKNFQSKKNSSANSASKENGGDANLLCRIVDNEQSVTCTDNGNNNNRSSSSSSEQHNGDTHALNTNKAQAQTSKASKTDDEAKIKFKMDSGATDHLSNEKDKFDILNSINPVNISVAKQGTKITASEQGNIKIKTLKKGDSSIKTIQNVLYVKDLQCNLLSIRRLAKLGYTITFKGDDATVSMNG